MDSTFGAPVFQQDDPTADVTTAAPNGQTTTQQLAAIDPNDPRLVSEVLDDKLDADAYAVPPPPPDGRWKAKLKLAKIKDPADGQQKDFIMTSRPGIDDGKPFYAVNVEVSLIDLSGKHDDVKLTEYWVKSNIDSRKGTSQMTTLCTKAGSPPPARATQKDRLDNALKTFAGEPQVIAETYWEVRCQNCETLAEKKGDRKPGAFLRGEARFPMKTGTSAHDANVSCPTCRSGCRAQVRVAQYFSVTETKPTRGLA